MGWGWDGLPGAEPGFEHIDPGQQTLKELPTLLRPLQEDGHRPGDAEGDLAQDPRVGQLGLGQVRQGIHAGAGVVEVLRHLGQVPPGVLGKELQGRRSAPELEEEGDEGRGQGEDRQGQDNLEHVVHGHLEAWPQCSHDPGSARSSAMLGAGVPMLHRLLYADWEEPPVHMDFELSFAEALHELGQLHARILPLAEAALAHPAQAPPAFWQDCLDLYLRAPALVNIALNHKICVEQGLPLHPTRYFEVSQKTRFQVHHPEPQVAEAQRFYLAAIEAARSLFALRPDAGTRLQAFGARAPEGISNFLYTGGRDRYTWRASDPRKVETLASEIRAKVQPVAIVGAAHGAIMAGLLLADLLDVPLYFVRFSLFKRKDTAPVISPSDVQHLAQWRPGPVLLFDEDVAKGTTLTAFTRFLEPFFDRSNSAGVLRHGFAAFRPDFVGKVWYD